MNICWLNILLLSNVWPGGSKCKEARDSGAPSYSFEVQNCKNYQEIFKHLLVCCTYTYIITKSFDL